METLYLTAGLFATHYALSYIFNFKKPIYAAIIIGLLSIILMIIEFTTNYNPNEFLKFILSVLMFVTYSKFFVETRGKK